MNVTQLVFEHGHVNGLGQFVIESYAIVDTYVTGYKLIQASIRQMFPSPKYTVDMVKSTEAFITKPGDDSYNAVLRIVEAPVIVSEDVDIAEDRIANQSHDKTPETEITITSKNAD